jgi:hypothetical protein
MGHYLKEMCQISIQGHERAIGDAINVIGSKVPRTGETCQGVVGFCIVAMEVAHCQLISQWLHAIYIYHTE